MRRWTRAARPAMTAGLVAGGMVFAAAGCGSGSDDSSAGSSGDSGYKVGTSISFLSAPFNAVLANLGVKAGKAAGLDMLSPVDAKSDPGKQISDFQTLLSQGVKGILVLPRDVEAIAPALQAAEAKEVPVVAFDNGVTSGKVAITVRADNVGMARSACEELGKRLKGEGHVLELQGDLQNTAGRDRTKGFEDCMKQQFPNIEITARPTKWEQERATDATQTVLTADKSIDGIYFQSDTIMLPGVLSVLKRLNRDAKVGEPGHVTLVGIDGGAFALDQIRAGQVDAIVSQPVDQYAKLGVDYLERAVAGETFKPGKTDHGSTIVQAGPNVEDLLPAKVATKDNVDDADLWGNDPAASE